MTGLVYLSTYFDNFYWHLTAAGRIILIKLLPYFDWRYLKNKQCIIEKNGIPSEKVSELFNCDLCEHINRIDVFESIDEDILTQHYLELDVPLIVTKGLENWPKNSSFVDDLILENDFYYSYPCKMSTNIYKGATTAGKILERARSFNEFFLHFQNCDLDAMKTLRKFTYRPSFLPAVYSPVLYNWLIWNRHYNATYDKVIDLVEKMALVGQVFGSMDVQLSPRYNCIEICPILDIKLNAGEVLVFTSLWDMTYRPNGGENVAVILETRD
ncbi:hypothetical protein NQ318_016545 [Aromia moschata]|uniref:Uncharacterized protein n=1 Tax=Aromia moschata TaxID=1265417 RepID=A0AAV8YWY8_9CUCU|nr:hypothetical protein NQ318_016545 [Aromia moschata]